MVPGDALNVTRIWIELAVWAAMVSTAQFSLSGSRLMASPGNPKHFHVPETKTFPALVTQNSSRPFSSSYACVAVSHSQKRRRLWVHSAYGNVARPDIVPFWRRYMLHIMTVGLPLCVTKVQENFCPRAL